MSKKHRKLKKRIKASRKKARYNQNAVNNHHCLWIGARFNSGHFTKLLRNHWYCQAYLPMYTLHKMIHDEIPNGLVVPSETTARVVYYRLIEMEKLSELSPKDNIVTKLQLLISLFDDDSSATVAGLRKQLNIVKKFYAESPK